MAKQSKNILRRHQSKKPMIIVLAILFVIVFLMVSYFYYRVLNYEYVHGVVNDMGGYVRALSDTSETKLPFFSALGDILWFNLKIWWVYLSVIAIMFIYVTSRNTNDFKNVEHGSARWANEREIKRLQKKKTGIPLAKDTYLPLKSKLAANLNETVIGGSGAGKSLRKCKADILQMNGSYVVTDPKGELYRDCAKVLKEHGYKVRVLNLINISYSNSYNPFDYIISEQDVVNIASLFMKNTAGEGEKSDFFSEAAGKLLVAVMLYLFKTENEIKTFGRVIRLLNSIRYKNGSIDMSCEFARCLNRHVSEYPNDAASINWSGMQANAQETQSSINEMLSTRLQLWATTDLDAITSTDEMDFDNIGKEKTAIFLIIPAAGNPYRAVSNIFYSQLFQRLMRVADSKYRGRLPQLVSFELDEFANIGEIPSFNEILAVARSYNIRICIIIQGLSQLKSIYEKTYDSIIGNCAIFTVLGSTDKDTLDYVSDKLGKTTARNDSRSFNRASMQGGGGQDTEAVAERPLLYPDEIKAAINPTGEASEYGGNSIVFVGYEYPMFLPKYDTFSHPLFNLCGSQYEGFTQNCTDIEKEYAPVWKRRLVEYKKMYNEYTENEKVSQQEYQAKVNAEDKAEQEQLEHDFSENNPVKPPSLSPTEEEYEAYAAEADTEDYEPVEDFDDDADEEFEDIAPIVSELFQNVGGVE